MPWVNLYKLWYLQLQKWIAYMSAEYSMFLYVWIEQNQIPHLNEHTNKY